MSYINDITIEHIETQIDEDTTLVSSRATVIIGNKKFSQQVCPRDDKEAKRLLIAAVDRYLYTGKIEG